LRGNCFLDTPYLFLGLEMFIAFVLVGLLLATVPLNAQAGLLQTMEVPATCP
jgi:hypothetical protein